MNSVIEKELKQNGMVAVRTDGDSMRPLLRHHRDVAVIERVPSGERLKKYEIALYRRNPEGPFTLHRILRVQKQDYVICGDNRWRREYGITDAQILGRLTEIRRDERTVSVTSAGYRCYTHLWCDLFYLRAAVLFFRDLPHNGKKLWKRMTARK